MQSSLALVSYSTSSIAMTITNKIILTRFASSLNFTLLLLQSIGTVVLMLVFSLLGLLPPLRSITTKLASKWLVVVCSLVGMIYTGSKALQHLPIPLFAIFKNFAIILTALLERIAFHGDPLKALAISSFALIILSSILAAWDDLKTQVFNTGIIGDLNGYIWMALNITTCSFYTLLTRARIRKIKFTDHDAAYYNNALSIPILALLVYMVEWDQLVDFIYT